MRGLALRYALAIAATAGLMIWQSGDAIRAGQPLAEVSLFWLISVSAGWLQMIVIARGVRSTFGPDRWPGWMLLLASALVGAVPLSFEVRWLVRALVIPENGMPAPWVTYLNVSVINIVFSLAQYVLIERWPLTGPLPEATPRPVTTVAPPKLVTPSVALLRRKPEGLHGAIRFMRMEDHYLRVHTDDGDGLILSRMSDAVADLTQTDGRQVHKSWWVSRSAVDRVERDKRKRLLVLKDGTEVPVGRSFEPDLRQDGWF